MNRIVGMIQLVFAGLVLVQNLAAALEAGRFSNRLTEAGVSVGETGYLSALTHLLPALALVIVLVAGGLLLIKSPASDGAHHAA